MESRGSSSNNGRYDSKGGGQQVGSFFDVSNDNERLKAIYGNYNLWSWLRYWIIDSENKVTMLLMDKSYYDYDYEKPSQKDEDALNAAKSDADITSKLKALGFGTRKKKPLTAEEIQKEVMRDNK